MVGRKLDQGSDDKIHEAALAAHSVGRYDIREVLVEGRAVIAVSVKRREEGFAQTSDGRMLIRKGGRNVALIGSELWDLMSRRSLRRFERTPSELLPEAANPRLLQEVCAVYGWHPEDENLAERLQERGLATSTHLTIAGALFLTRPADSLNLRKASVEVRRYADEGTDFDILPAMNDQDSNRSPGGNVLRFALHRQGQNSQVSTRCHGMPCRG